MATVAFTTRANLVGGQPENIADVTSCLDALLAGANGIDKEQLTTALAQLLGVNNGSNVGRGKSIIATEESRTNTAYGLMTTPDRVSSVVLPTDGLIAVAVQAMWKNSVASNGRAAIFLGSNQLRSAVTTGGSTPVQEAIANTTANVYRPLGSARHGLDSTPDPVDYTGDVTTGQVVSYDTLQGGVAYIFAAAGTYDVSVQFKSASGSVTVKNRKLWVWTLGF